MPAQSGVEHVVAGLLCLLCQSHRVRPCADGAAMLGLQVSSDESERLIKMEETLHQRVIGQEEAVVAISRAIRRARVGLKNPNRPIASFIFSGPTGVLPRCRAAQPLC